MGNDYSGGDGSGLSLKEARELDLKQKIDRIRTQKPFAEGTPGAPGVMRLEKFVPRDIAGWASLGVIGFVRTAEDGGMRALFIQKEPPRDDTMRDANKSKTTMFEVVLTAEGTPRITALEDLSYDSNQAFTKESDGALKILDKPLRSIWETYLKREQARRMSEPPHTEAGIEAMEITAPDLLGALNRIQDVPYESNGRHDGPPDPEKHKYSLGEQLNSVIDFLLPKPSQFDLGADLEKAGWTKLQVAAFKESIPRLRAQRGNTLQGVPDAGDLLMHPIMDPDHNPALR